MTKLRELKMRMMKDQEFLEIRSPRFVESIRAGTTKLVESIESDAEVRHAMEVEGISDPPSQWYANEVGQQDASFARAVQQLVDNPRIGGKLINSRWQLVRLGARDGTFVFADYPVVRLPEREVGFLPLDPRAALCIFRGGSNREGFIRPEIREGVE